MSTSIGISEPEVDRAGVLPSLLGRTTHVARGRGSLIAGLSILSIVLVPSFVVSIAGLGHPDALNLGSTFQGPSLSHWFGTDDVGRDLFIRTLYATKTDVVIGISTALIPMIIGLGLGVIAAHFGSWTDAIIGRVTDFVLSFPFIVLVMAVVVVLGSGLTGIYIGLIIKGFPAYVRLTRGEALVVREKEFVLSARTLGLGRMRIILKHELPHLLGPNFIYSISDALSNMILLASLSYLGLGISPPTPEWGSMIAEGQQYLTNAWWISTLPGLVVVFFGLGMSLTGEALAERLRERLS